MAAVNPVEENKAYVGGVKIFGAGLLEDPVPGCKRGKGAQNLNSSVWLLALGEFIAQRLPALQAILAHAHGLDYVADAGCVPPWWRWRWW
jgi:hypothetical protein